jgi:hypothetical protein
MYYECAQDEEEDFQCNQPHDRAVYTTMDFEADTEVQSHFGSYSGSAPHCRDHKIYRTNCWACESLLGKGATLSDPPKQLTVVIKRVVFDETVLVNEKVS